MYHTLLRDASGKKQKYILCYKASRFVASCTQWFIIRFERYIRSVFSSLHFFRLQYSGYYFTLWTDRLSITVKLHHHHSKPSILLLATWYETIIPISWMSDNLAYNSHYAGLSKYRCIIELNGLTYPAIDHLLRYSNRRLPIGECLHSSLSNFLKGFFFFFFCTFVLFCFCFCFFVFFRGETSLPLVGIPAG